MIKRICGVGPKTEGPAAAGRASVQSLLACDTPLAKRLGRRHSFTRL